MPISHTLKDWQTEGDSAADDREWPCLIRTDAVSIKIDIAHPDTHTIRDREIWIEIADGDVVAHCYDPEHEEPVNVRIGATGIRIDSDQDGSKPLNYDTDRYERMEEFMRQLARMDPPDEREEIAEVDGEIEAFSHMIRKAKELVGVGAPAPATPAITGTERAMFDLLCENFDAWDGEEDSVKEEHEDLIEKTEAFIDAHKARICGSAA